jgi:Kef-type K+ transport system membrane component KefB
MQITTKTLIYLVAIFGLLVVPRALQRFRLPAQLTCFGLGIVVTIFLRSLVDEGLTSVLATMGIASLFLFAGLDVDLGEIRRQVPRLSIHLAISGIFLAGFAWLAMRYVQMTWQPAVLLALGLLTPSTGFILDTLRHSGLEPAEQNEVSINAIAGEIVAVLMLFVVSQAGSVQTLAISSGVLLLLIVLTPLLFLALGRYVVPVAPGSEFSLLIMVGIICSVLTKNLGVHYLVGAFVAGLVAGLLRKRMATLASPENLHAVRLFASFFIPFYFFHEGMGVPSGALVLKSLEGGALLSVTVLPIRLAKNWLRSRFLSRRSGRGAMRVSIALAPTLIFTLVIAGMLRQMFHMDDTLYGSLLVYAGISTLLPSLILPGLAPRGVVADMQEASDLPEVDGVAKAEIDGNPKVANQEV